MLVFRGKILIPRNWDADVMVLLDTINKEVPININSIGGKTLCNGEKVTGVIVNDKFNLCKEYHHNTKPKLKKCFGYISYDEITHDYVCITVIGDIKQEKIWVERDKVKNYYDLNIKD